MALALIITLALAACQSGTSTTANHTATPSVPPTTSSPTTGSPTATNPGGPAATTWAQLEQRPLHLPTLAPGSPCPITPAQQGVSPDYTYVVGSGPVYLVTGLTNGVFYYNQPQNLDPAGGPWGGEKVFWQINPVYTGLVLIRGQQVDGNHPLRFNGGLDFTPTNPLGTEPLLNELRLKGGGNTAPSWPTWVTITRVEAPGCYAYQVDGENFTEVITFPARSL